MKALRLSLLFILSLVYSTGFSQNVVNGSFEKWDKREYYTLNSWFHPIRNVSRTLDSKEGKYALKLENTLTETGTSYRSYCYNRYPTVGLNGFAFTDEVLSLVFWAKYDLPPGDSARIIVYMREEGVTRGYVNFKMYGNTNDNYVKHSIPIYWYSSRTPDTAWIYLYSYTDTEVDGPGYVIFDDIHFENIGQRGHDMTNQGFEEWTDLGIDFPQHWRSLDLLYYDTYLTFLSERSAFRSSDALLGNSSLKITNYDSANPRRTYIYIGTENDDYYTPCFKIYQKYAYFQGYYKMESDAEDSAFIQFRTFENGQLLSNSFMYLTPTTKWTHFSFPINYYRDSIPDSAALIAYSGVGTIKSAQTALYLDGLDLVMQPYSVGISDVDSRFRMYPNPVESEIHILLQEPMYCVILDVQGREVLRMELLAGRNSIDLSSQPTGIYYIRLVNDNYQWQKIVVKQ